MMQNTDWNAIVDQVVSGVLNKLERDMPENETVQGTVLLAAAYVPSPKTATQALVARYGENMECILFENADFHPFGVKTERLGQDITEKELMAKVAERGRVVLVTPGIGTLARIANGDDSGFLEYLVLRALLWGREVAVLLDFQLPKFKRNTFFERIIDIADALTSMGVKLLQYRCAGEEAAERHVLVTQTEVDDAARQGKKAVFCAEGAIVTPLARERAGELGIEIE